MRYEDLNWMDIEDYLKHDDRLMLVIGACEQHGHLSLTADVRIPQAIADAASHQSGVPVAPALNFGASPYFLDYPGTFSLRTGTLLDVLEDLVRSAHAQGFRRLLILNGHGGNNCARTRLVEVNNDLPDLRLNWYSWWLAHSVEAIAQKHGIHPAHANWLEAFPFTIVHEMPDGSKTPPYVPSDIMDTKTTRKVYGDGSFGDQYKVDDGIMQEIFNSTLQDVLDLLKFEGWGE